MLSISGANVMMNVGMVSMISACAIIVLTSLNIWTYKETRLALRVILILILGFAS